MNVCFFNDITVLGGGELWVLNTAMALRRNGHAASIVSPYRSPLYRAAIERGIDVHGHMLGDATPFHEPLFHYLQSRDVDVVYCTVIGRFCEAAVLGRAVQRLNAARPQRPAVLLLKTGLPPLGHLGPSYYGFGDWCAARRLHVVSEENRRRYIEWVPDAEPFVALAREGVDLSRFRADGVDAAAGRAKWQLPADARIITCASRLDPQKGQDNLLLAAKDIVARHSDVCFVFAGTGRDEGRLKALSAHLGLNGHARFLGHVDDMPQLLAASDVVCQPSLAEGMPNAVIEAMAMEKPVVASAVGGIPEIITDDQNGLLTRPHDVRQLIGRLSALLGNAELRTTLGRNAAAKVRAEMDFSVRHAQWESMVAEEVRAARSSPPATTASFARLRHHPVLFLLTHLRTGGEETEVALLAKHLDSRRFPVSVATAYAVHEPSPAKDRMGAIGAFVDEGCHELPTLEDKAAYLVRFIRERGIRIVVACQDTQLAYRVFQQLSPDECRLIEHAGIVQETGRIPKTFTSRLVGVSAAIAREAATHLPRADHARYLPSMVDAEEFRLQDREHLRGAYGFAASDVVVVFGGRLDAKKGIDVLIDGAARLLPELPELRFVIVGPPDAFQLNYARHLQERVRRELPAGRFTLAGARRDLASILVAADICVLPSQGEGMSHVINEAGAAGLPVIAYDDGAASEQLLGGKVGILVPAGDSDAFTREIRDLARDPDRRVQLGAALRAHVLARFSTQSVMPAWHALLEEVASDLEPSRVPLAVRGVAADRLLPFPSEIQIETNTACNATCIMCPYPEVAHEMRTGALPVRGGRMDASLYQKILDECAQEPSLRRLEPFLNNEPFTDTRIVDLIALAKRTVPHALLTVTSNGSLVTPKVTDRLIGSGLDAIWFSFNGATKETYEKIMGLSFDTVKRNIDYLLDKKPSSLRVFTNMIDTIPMSGEIAENIEYWHSRGVQSGASPFVNRAGNVANFDELNYRTLSAQPSRVCELLYYKMYIGYNGDVLLCCMDWRRRIVLGNVREKTLREIWQSDTYQHYRSLHEQNRANELDLCRTCSYIHA